VGNVQKGVVKALEGHLMPILLSMANRNRDVVGRLFKGMQCENQYIILIKGFDDTVIIRLAPVIDILGCGGYDPERTIPPRGRKP